MEPELEFLNETEELQHIALCLCTLYRTPIGSVALDRDFGLDWSFLDLPIPAAKARLEGELVQKTAKYEPRVRVREILWEYAGRDGEMKPKVVLEIV